MAFPRAHSLSPHSAVLRPHSRSLARVFAPLAFDPTVLALPGFRAHGVEHVIVAAPGCSRTTSNDGWQPSTRVLAADRALHSHVEVH